MSAKRCTWSNRHFHTAVPDDSMRCPGCRKVVVFRKDPERSGAYISIHQVREAAIQSRVDAYVDSLPKPSHWVTT